MSEPKPMPSYWALAEEVTHLHGQLDQLKAENAELREQLQDAKRMRRVAWDRVRNAERQIEKLQALCGELLNNLMPEVCAKHHLCRDKDWHACNDYTCGNYTFVILAQDLGVKL